MGFAHKACAAGGLGFVAALLAGCGSSGGLLSTEQAGSLKSQLDQVSVAVQQRQCGTVDDAIAGLNRTIEGFGGLNQTLVSNLQQGVETVGALADQNCQGIFNHTTSSTTSSTSLTTASSTKTTSSTSSKSSTSSTSSTISSTPTSTTSSATPTTTTSSSTTPVTPSTSTSTPPPTNPTGGAGVGGPAGQSTSGGTGGGSPTG